VKITFEALQESHLALIHKWFNEPHVQKYYSLRPWTLEQIHQKLTPHITKEKTIDSFVVFLDQIPIGYIQSYAIAQFPWEDQELSEKIVKRSTGIDFFIGDPLYVGQGYGQEIVLAYLNEKIWPHFRYCLADPDSENKASLHLFKKLGFHFHKEIKSHNALGQPRLLSLYLKEKISSGNLS